MMRPEQTFFRQVGELPVSRPEIPRVMLQNQAEITFVETILKEERTLIIAAITLHNELEVNTIDENIINSLRQSIQAYNLDYHSPALRESLTKVRDSNAHNDCYQSISKQSLAKFMEVEQDVFDKILAARMTFLSQHSQGMLQNNRPVAFFNLIFCITLILLFPPSTRTPAFCGFLLNLLWGVPYIYYADIQVARSRLEEIYPKGNYFRSAELNEKFAESSFQNEALEISHK